MLSNLIYVSTRTPLCTDSEIGNILRSCQANNHGIGITGVLLYSPTNFVQYIEGDFKTLIALYDKIKIDKRHRSATLISTSPINDRSFPNWQMGAKKVDLNSIEFQTGITAGDKQLFERILSGQQQDSNKAIALVRKFFK